MPKKPLDWTKTGTIEAMGEWIRSSSGALVVVVVRVDDAVLLADPELAPNDARELLFERIPPLVADLAAARNEKRKGGRVQIAPVGE